MAWSPSGLPTLRTLRIRAVPQHCGTAQGCDLPTGYFTVTVAREATFSMGVSRPLLAYLLGDTRLSCTALDHTFLHTRDDTILLKVIEQMGNAAGEVTVIRGIRC